MINRKVGVGCGGAQAAARSGWQAGCQANRGVERGAIPLPAPNAPGARAQHQAAQPVSVPSGDQLPHERSHRVSRDRELIDPEFGGERRNVIGAIL